MRRKQKLEKRGRREKGKRLRSKEGVWIVCLAKFSRTSAIFLRWRVLGIRMGFSGVCVPAVPTSVPVETLLFWNAKMWFVRLFSLIRIVNFVEPQTFLSPENAKCVLWKAKNV